MSAVNEYDTLHFAGQITIQVFKSVRTTVKKRLLASFCPSVCPFMSTWFLFDEFL
jgi:hypothetical protein